MRSNDQKHVLVADVIYAVFTVWLTTNLTCLLVSPGLAQSVRGEAYAGRPLGVGLFTVPLSPNGNPAVVQTSAYQLSESHGRIMYPAVDPGGLVSRLRQQLDDGGAELPRQITVFFLFRGSEPLDLTFHGTSRHRFTLTPRQRPRVHRLTLRRWWRQYNDMVRRQRRLGDYPPIVETYLSNMLAGRMNFLVPVLGRDDSPRYSQPRQALELVLGTEELRRSIMSQTLRGEEVNTAIADLPVPAEPVWPELVLPELLEQPEIEPIASHVPQECFYIRFGNFGNYLWLKNLTEEYGGDVARMIRLRGHNARLNERMQRQLALKESALAEILGPKVIADIALIGRDLFLREGAAIGVLFQARLPLLGTDLAKQRADALKRDQALGASETTVTIAGREVSFLSTPGNELRSFYAVDGNFHLVTTSRAMVERFFAAGQGDGSLAQSAEFAHARAEMPLSRDDSIFVYMSSRFFEGLASPQYQIELRRRMKAVTDIELLQLARLAAGVEQRPSGTIQQLIAARLLPAGFGNRPDQSRLLMEGQRVYDSVRGSRGTFLPVPDMNLNAVTQTEADRYAVLRSFYQHNWRQIDPLMVALRRSSVERGEDIERVTVDARMVPFNSQQYGTITSMLGPPTAERVAPTSGDIASVQAVVQGGLFRPNIGVHHMFLGLQDILPPGQLPSGPIRRAIRLLTTTPGYLGTWPNAGLLDSMPLINRAPPDLLGYSSLPLGLWRRQFNGFSVVSFSRPILETITPELRLEQMDNNAQVRIQVGDLMQAEIGPWINSLYRSRAEQASLGNARFLHTLSQQLNVARSECRNVAENLLDSSLTCALGGDYELTKNASGLEYWTSSALVPGNQTATSYEAPPLAWFRGLRADLTMQDDRLHVHGEIDIQRKANGATGFPFLNLFGGKDKQPAEVKQQTLEEVEGVEELPEPKER